MHPPEERAQIKELVAAGVNDCEISRRTGIPRATVRDVRCRKHQCDGGAPPAGGQARFPGICPRCWGPAVSMHFTSEDYVELLGLYLGDGCISKMGRTFRMRIALDAAYPGIIYRTADILSRCFPSNGIGIVRQTDSGCRFVSVYNSHLPCLFPQHGPGRKHDRRIELEHWQLDHVNAAPWSFIRGAIYSDGCVFVNRTGRYEYLSYAFVNQSADIARLLFEACSQVGLRPRLTGRQPQIRQLRINRREDVALMLERVGIKA